MTRFDAVVFDFDGVLVESVEVKTRAFASLYANYGTDIVEQVVVFHLANGGLSRFEKFRYFHDKLIGLPLTNEGESRLAADFNTHVEELVVTAPWVDGAEDFLIEHHKGIPLFVASGTPEEELKRILKKRRMSQYFHAAFGSPAKKGEILRSILEYGDFQPEKVLMVGDSLLDLESARETGTCFLGRLTPPCNIFPADVPILPNLVGLRKFIHGN